MDNCLEERRLSDLRVHEVACGALLILAQTAEHGEEWPKDLVARYLGGIEAVREAAHLLSDLYLSERRNRERGAEVGVGVKICAEYDGTQSWVDAEMEASRLVGPVWDWLENQPTSKQAIVAPTLSKLKDALVHAMLSNR